jgi:hypothetical protein
MPKIVSLDAMVRRQTETPCERLVYRFFDFCTLSQAYSPLNAQCNIDVSAPRRCNGA